MKKLSSLSLILFTSLFSPLSISAINIADNNTDTVHLKNDCTGISNCANTLTELMPWVWGTRAPSTANPLLIKVGTGTFFTEWNDPFGGSFCKDAGNVTVIGSGVDNTIIKNVPSATLNGLSMNNCVNLSFQDLTFDFAKTIYGIFWRGDGNSNYSNIKLIGGGAAWYDEQCTTENSKHYFVSSTITAKGFMFSPTTAYLSRCAESWFIGSELTAISKGGNVSTIFAEGDPEIHVYGSSIRALSKTGQIIPGGSFSLTPGLVAVTSNQQSEVHIHGTGIDVISPEANAVTALVTGGGTIHANQSSFVLKTAAGGSKTRLKNISGKIIAPYLWGNQVETNGVVSIHGEDISVSTDTADNQPHLLIYSDNCASNWFDSTTGTCKQ